MTQIGQIIFSGCARMIVVEYALSIGKQGLVSLLCLLEQRDAPDLFLLQDMTSLRYRYVNRTSLLPCLHCLLSANSVIKTVFFDNKLELKKNM